MCSAHFVSCRASSVSPESLVPMITHENVEEMNKKQVERDRAKLGDQSPAMAVCKRVLSRSGENFDSVIVKRGRLGAYNGCEAENSADSQSQVIEQRTPSIGITGEVHSLHKGNEGETTCPVGRMEPKSSTALNPKSKGESMNTTGFIRLEAEVAEDRGSRHTMEDTWVLVPDAWQDSPGSLRCAHFAIYDGHGGRHAAEYARAHLHANVLSAGLPRESMDIKGVKRAIIAGFKSTDDGLLRESSAGGWQDGATAVCVWVLGQMVFVANVGDAKAVLARVCNKAEGEDVIDPKAGTNVDQSVPLKGFVLTREHKAIYPQERTRIVKAGGYVEANGRLLGRLEVSRAFGDRTFKKAGVIVTPDVHVFELTERERFLILGCDGLWGVFGPSDAVDFISTQFKEGASVSLACKRLIREAVRERKCKDNCTAIIIKFGQPSS